MRKSMVDLNETKFLQSRPSRSCTRTFVLGKRTATYVLLLTIALCAINAPAQTSSTQSVNCQDSAQSSSEYCQAQTMRLPSSLPASLQGKTQESDSTSREIYIDSAGYPNSTATSGQQQR